jgi:hypothetical protein
MYLFMAGEFYASLPLVLKANDWYHTLRSARLYENDNGSLRRECVHEDIHGIIYHCDVEDKSIERHNLDVIKKSNTVCWPPIDVIEPMLDRFYVLHKCCEAGFVTHDVWIANDCNVKSSLKFPYVLKVGNIHRGEGKYLIKSVGDIPTWSGTASAEPFFDGESYRVFVVGDREFVVHIRNDESWIRNSLGGDVSVVGEPTLGLVKHARQVCEEFRLELAGIDYIVDADGFHLLEANVFPGLNYGDETKPVVEEFLRSKMTLVEQSYKNR